jgi:hypothetical protein
MIRKKKQSLSPILDCSGVVRGEIRFMEEFRVGVLSEMGDLKDGSLEEKAILYDDNGRVVMEFFPTFKVAKDTTIKGVTFNGCDFALPYRKSATFVLAHPEETTS